MERNRLRFLGWLAEAAGRLSLWAGEFDVQGIQRPKPADVPMCEGWWVIRPEALPVYIARVLHSEPQYRPKSNALLLTTIYLLAMRVSGGEDGAADATLQLRRIGRAEFVPAEIRRVADQVRIGELAPHATWIGPLEWALLQLAGVRWPGYVVDLAQLREGCQDEIDREVGLRLVKGLGGYLPLIIGAGDRDEQRVLRHCHAFSGDVVTQLREVLLESARQAARDTAHPAPQRRDAGIAVIGLLIRAYGGSWSDKQKESLRDVAEAGLDAVSVLATRLLRHPPDACDRSAKDEFWKCCEQPAPPAAEQPQITAQPTAAPAQHAPNFEWIEVEGKRYEFSKAQQRAVVQVLWEAAGRPLHETSVGDAINSTTDYFRLKTVFRVKGGAKHPAMGKVLIKTAPRTYRLAR